MDFAFTGYEHIQPTELDISEQETNEFIESIVNVTAEEHRRVKSLPQHNPDGSTNDEWIAARRYRFTGSAAGAFGMQNPYETCEDYVEKKITPQEMDERGKRYCAWGNAHEDDCEEAFLKKYHAEKLHRFTRDNGDEFLGIKIHHLGLYICKAPPPQPGEANYAMLGMSPDGIAETKWRSKDTGEVYSVFELCEWKCPATWMKKTSNSSIYKVELLPKTFPTRVQPVMGKLPPTDGDTRYRFPCPSYYFSQIQYGMELFNRSGLHVERAWFGVWDPNRVAVTCIPRDASYGNWILNRGRDVWLNEFVPQYLRDRKLKELYPAAEPSDHRMEEDDGDVLSMFSGFTIPLKTAAAATHINENGKRMLN